MSTLESLLRIIGNTSRAERKFVRSYLLRRSQNDLRPNKMLKLFDVLIADHNRQWTTAELEKRLELQRHHATFGRLVSQLHKRVIEALSLPVAVVVNESYSERTKALLQYHRQYLKALILFEAGNYALADETLLSLVMLTEKYELHAERMAAAEFLMRTIRIYGNEDALKYFKDIPEQSRRALTVAACAENIRELIDEGTYPEAQIKFTLLNESIKGVASRQALFVMKGIRAKAAALGGKYKNAERLFLDQLGCSNHDAVWSEEVRAQVYADIAENALRLKKDSVAKEYIAMVLRCRRMFKKTTEQLEKLRAKMNGSAPTSETASSKT